MLITDPDLISLVLADRYTEEYKRIISDTQSMKPEGLPPTKRTQDTTRMTIVPPTPPIMRNHDDAVFGNQELLSRVDTLKELIVDEGLFREGRLLHTLESEFNYKQARDEIEILNFCFPSIGELQNMLSHIRLSRRKSSNGEHLWDET